jgi:hypothetical protein
VGPGNRTDELYLSSGPVTQDDVLVAVRALRADIGDDPRFLAFPFKQLAWRIGMTHTTLEADREGNFVMSSQGVDERPGFGAKRSREIALNGEAWRSRALRQPV